MRTILTPPGPPGAALVELKSWLAISADAEDVGLTALLCTALESCEAFTGQTLADDWEEIPQALRHGAIRLAAHLYRERDGEPGTATPPPSVAALWRPWRRLHLA
jgi:hypothetical protein